ncbi:hypothetical protein [Tahibacter soli]|uniref:Restriction endonuclease n=1 Tax=Tahibacter soli TaxID=2983605 RepID=A0A9X4BH99_9GAMM|nr:hypothetical protein [Tahibacter soli]MDC8012566.1 hypothetical protein [Tahibacter soli]
MTERVTFFSRCKPQNVDAVEIARDHRRIFIGYPLARPGVKYDPRNLRNCVVDLLSDEDTWLAAHSVSDRRRAYNANRNLVGKVVEGSMAMIPRPEHGVAYCGRVISGFELVDNPAWYDAYMTLRGDTDTDDTWHSADIGQCWRVDEFKPLPVSRIPGWIRRSLYGRSTFGVIHPDSICGDPTPVMDALLENRSRVVREWTLDPRQIERRLLEDSTPTVFEHLVVSLLQLEHSGETWIQVGGVGDGGIDGVGFDANGDVCGLLQCKWQYWGEEVFAGATTSSATGRPIRRYLAVLRDESGGSMVDGTFLDAGRIAELLAKHHARLPLAVSLRVGSGA